MSFDVTDAALDRMVEAIEAPAPATEPVAPTPTQGSEAAPEGTTPTPEAPAAEDSFLERLNPNDLPPELLPYYRSMQADYTRKTQSIADQSRALDGLDPVAARGALEFVESLNNDPDFAVRVHRELSSALEQAGLTPAQAAQVAAEQVTQAANEWDTEYTDQPAPVNPEIMQRLERTEQFMESFEQSQQQQQFEYALQQQENAIRQSHPEWDEADMETIYSLAFANGGNLLQASDQYLAEQTRWASRFLSQKQSVPTSQPGGGATGYVPEGGVNSLKDATAAAIERFRAQQ